MSTPIAEKPNSTASWGTYNTVNAEAAVGGPLGGGFSFRASGLLQRRDNWVENTSTTGVANDASQFTLGYVHNLSKRTALYANYSMVDNKGAGTNYNVGAPVIKPGGQRVHAEGTHPCRRQLQRERYPVKSATNCRHQRSLALVWREAWRGRTRAFDFWRRGSAGSCTRPASTWP